MTREQQSTIIPVSADEYEASAAGRVPALVDVADGIRMLPIPIPATRSSMAYTLTYLLRDADGGVHIVDPGWSTDGNARTVIDAMSGLGRPASIIVTHLHPDHIGLAARLRDELGIPVVVHPAEREAQQRIADREEDLAERLAAWGVPVERRQVILDEYPQPPVSEVVGDLLVEDGALLDIPGRRIRALFTPGHTGGHLCLLDEERRMLFSGDHVLPVVNPGVGLGGAGDDALALYLDGLDRMRALDDCQVLPGHGFRFHGLAARATQIARHHLRRLDEVAAVVAREPDAEVWRIASQLTWSRGFEGLRRQYMIGALRQTAMHLRLVRAGDHERMHGIWSD